MPDLETIIARTFATRTPARHADSLDALDADSLGELLPDYLRSSIGGTQARSVHPLLPAIQRERLTLGELRERSGVTSSDLSTAMNAALATLMTARYSNLTTDISRLCRQMPAQDFRPQANLGFAIGEPEEVAEDGDSPQLKVTVSPGTSGQMKTLGGRLSFSRRIFATYGAELTAGVLAYADAFSAVEGQMLAATLESASLTEASGTLTVSGLATAAAALRDSPNLAGSKSNLAASILLVPSAMEATARVLVAALDRWPTLLVSSYLSSATTYYVMASPVLAPKLLRYTLAGSSGPRIYSSFDDASKAQFAVFHDVGFAVGAGPGVVKVAP